MNDFVSWAEEHCRVFGLTSDEARTVLSWEPYFTAAGFHHDDLGETTKALAADPAGMVRMAGDAKFLGKCAVHMAAIERYIRDRTARRADDDRTAFEATHGQCSVCGGSGFVVVPHPSGITSGRWVPIKTGRAKPTFYTAAVLCDCALGRWKGEHQGGKTKAQRKPQMTLEAYERKNPKWREQMAQHDKRLKERFRLSNPRFDADLKAVLERFGPLWQVRQGGKG